MAEHGFAAPGLDAQRVFRTLLTALAEPGRVMLLAPGCLPPEPLDPVAAAVVLALCDADTPLWLAPSFAAAADFLRFHTGAPVVPTPAAASFVVSDVAHRPPLAALDPGTPDYPDRAATLILAVAALEENAGWRLAGPGVPGRRAFRPRGVDDGFRAERQAQQARFPLGVDVVFCARDRLAGLPRSTRLEG